MGREKGRIVRKSMCTNNFRLLETIVVLVDKVESKWPW
jgi:hypothetical protein